MVADRRGCSGRLGCRWSRPTFARAAEATGGRGPGKRRRSVSGGPGCLPGAVGRYTTEDYPANTLLRRLSALFGPLEFAHCGIHTDPGDEPGASPRWGRTAAVSAEIRYGVAQGVVADTRPDHASRCASFSNQSRRSASARSEKGTAATYLCRFSPYLRRSDVEIPGCGIVGTGRSPRSLRLVSHLYRSSFVNPLQILDPPAAIHIGNHVSRVYVDHYLRRPEDEIFHRLIRIFE
jgi:hypothetical protein